MGNLIDAIWIAMQIAVGTVIGLMTDTEVAMIGWVVVMIAWVVAMIAWVVAMIAWAVVMIAWVVAMIVWVVAMIVWVDVMIVWVDVTLLPMVGEEMIGVVEEYLIDLLVEEMIDSVILRVVVVASVVAGVMVAAVAAVGDLVMLLDLKVDLGKHQEFVPTVTVTIVLLHAMIVSIVTVIEIALLQEMTDSIVVPGTDLKEIGVHMMIVVTVLAGEIFAMNVLHHAPERVVIGKQLDVKRCN